MPSLQALIARHGLDPGPPDRYILDDQIAVLAAADACVCLRWPTAGETSASWLRALAAGTPTVITALAHLTDVPTIDAATGRRSHPSQAPVAVSVDLLDEENAVGAAMARLSADAQLRSDLASAGYAHWCARAPARADGRRLPASRAGCGGGRRRGARPAFALHRRLPALGAIEEDGSRTRESCDRASRHAALIRR
jgi:hypothetical protein